MKSGEKYILTTDQYSDFKIRDCFVALCDFSFDRELDAWLAAHPSPDADEVGERSFGDDFGSGSGTIEPFLASLRERGLVADANANVVHLANYGAAQVDPARDRYDGDSP